jgi:DNA-binding response OmpR family regulator
MDTNSSAHDTDLEEDHATVKTIVIVEDDESVGEFLLRVIQNETPYQAALASHGFEALTMVQTLKPNLLILDYDLPDMNGLELYDKIHAIKAMESLPALVVTAQSVYKEVKARRIPLLKKPFELTDLLQEIERLLA